MAALSARNDVWVERREQRIEVTAARGSEEGIDNFSLAGEIGVGNRGHSLHPAAGAAGELSCCARRAPHDGSKLVKRHGEHVVQHERHPLGGSQRLEHHEQRQTDRVGQQRFLLRVDPVLAAPDRLGHVRVQGLLSMQLARAQHRHTRATTVVSHPPRFSTALVSERLRRSQDSCTASSASLSEPSIR
jgi:hypothetical protein